MGNIVEKTKTTLLISSEMIKPGPYQRPTSKAWVEKILKNWNEMKANAPKVSFRDGTYYIFDGQHTLEARIRRNNGKPVYVECEVYYGLTETEEASLFVSLNDDRRKVRPNERLKAKIISGDEDAKKLVSIIEKNGFKPNYSGGATPGYVTCLSAAMSIMHKNEKALDWALSSIKKLWGDDVSGTNNAIIGGMAEFYDTYINDTRFDYNRFIRGLSTVSPSIIVREGREMLVGGNKRFAKRIAFYYNKGLKSNKLDISKLD